MYTLTIKENPDGTIDFQGEADDSPTKLESLIVGKIVDFAAGLLKGDREGFVVTDDGVKHDIG